MAENAAKPVLVEYDAKRPCIRLLFGFLEAIAFVGYQHGYTAKLPPPLPCNGGWTEGLQFLTYFGILAVLIEVIHWIIWRIVHRKEILSFEEEQRLFGKTTRLGVRNRGFQSPGVQELFRPSLEFAEGTSPSAVPRDYVLVESGGRLPLVPTNPALTFVFGLALLILVLLFHSPGSVDSCAPSTFSWPDLFGRLIVAYAFLAFGSIAEFKIVGVNRPSAPQPVLPVVGAFVIGIAFTVLGTILWNSHAGLGDSPMSKLLGCLLLLTFGPGEFVALIINGGNVHNELNLVIAQFANLMIYTGLGYVFMRFLDWRRINST